MAVFVPDATQYLTPPFFLFFLSREKETAGAQRVAFCCLSVCLSVCRSIVSVILFSSDFAGCGGLGEGRRVGGGPPIRNDGDPWRPSPGADAEVRYEDRVFIDKSD